MNWIALGIMSLVAGSIALWMAGAIYYDACGGAMWGRLFAFAWLLGVVALFAAWQPLWQPFVVLLAVSIAFLVWWMRLRPRQDRVWEPTAAVLPRVIRTGDVFTIENVRNFEYRTLDDYVQKFETRAYRLANLRGLEIVFFTWGSPWMNHPAFIFDFGEDGRICMSIEVRFRKGQKYSVVRSLYRQQELIFLAADERDVILRRTKYAQGEGGYLYRFIADLSEIRAAFLDYVDAINSLYDTPRWYHALFANCTTSFYRLANSRWRLDWRVFVNGRLDRALYSAGRLDHSVPFPELRRRAYLNDIANEAPAEGFGDYVRREMEKRHER